METEKGAFYVGNRVDLDTQERTEDVFSYKASNFTTHGVIVGMTGSGKTGLGMCLLEEALLQGVPCLIIDPKGDMGNLKLMFPEFRPEDFRPWIDEAEADQKGVTPDELATAKSELWRRGLARSGIEPERLNTLRDGTKITIYTPGSAAGVGLNVIGSLAPPDLVWEGSESESIRDEIEALVSSLLVMADIKADSVTSPEHILIATIIETFWKNGKSLDLQTLVGQIPNPPIRKLGVFDVDTFFPEKDRMALAMKLNGLLASPSFASWLEGVPLDIEHMIGGEGPTKAAVVYLSHLSDSERQFVVTLLLSKMVTWLRGQPGTSNLRALIYMDEVFGFAPPTAEPPSKKPILTILKQARAHGVGMVLSTQNPVDLDYKAMSNAGTWMVGRLQTENDKKRILEGLESASGAVDVNAYDTLISDLEKRQFVLNSTKSSGPSVFATRWAMSYLAGPLTRDQVTSLTEDRPEPEKTTEPSAEPPPFPPDDTVPVAPPVASGVSVGFLDPAAIWAAEVEADPTATKVEASAVATVNLLYDDQHAKVSHREVHESVIFPLSQDIAAESFRDVDHDPRDFRDQGPDGASFALPEARIDTKTFWTSLKSDLKSHLVANRSITVYKNPELKLYSRVGESEEAFEARCAEAAEEAADQEMAKLKTRYETRIDRVRKTLAKSENRVQDLEANVAAKEQEELMSGAGDLLGALLGGRRRSNPLGQAAKRRAASQRARSRAETAAANLQDDQIELEELEDELAERIAEIDDEYRDKATEIETVEIPLEKSDIEIADIKLIWIPR
jgi:hypothetical protein